MAVKRYLDVSELAGYLGVSKWLVYKLIEDRDIPFVPLGRLIRFDRLAIDKWAEKRTVPAAPSRRARNQNTWNKTEGSDVSIMGSAAN